MELTLFHNPKCSKSRETLKLLNEKGVSPKIVLYLNTPPTEIELKGIVKKLGIPAKSLVRFKESVASELGLTLSDGRSDTDWIKLMCAHPHLIERPLLISDQKAVIGRPPERVLDLIGK